MKVHAMRVFISTTMMAMGRDKHTEIPAKAKIDFLFDRLSSPEGKYVRELGS